MDNLPELADILGLMATDPLEAAARLEAMAGELLGVAGRLRESASGCPRDRGGMADKVSVHVIGPDGQVKQRSEGG